MIRNVAISDWLLEGWRINGKHLNVITWLSLHKFNIIVWKFKELVKFSFRILLMFVSKRINLYDRGFSSHNWFFFFYSSSILSGFFYYVFILPCVVFYFYFYIFFNHCILFLYFFNRFMVYYFIKNTINIA